MALSVDPDAERLMALASALLRERDVVKRQQRQLWALAVALRAERAASASLIDLCETLLSDLDA